MVALSTYLNDMLVSSRPAPMEIILLCYMIPIVTSAESSYLSIQSCMGMTHGTSNPIVGTWEGAIPSHFKCRYI
ncbi:hypothetical protein OUZ56_016316 [Daphnia magna]|uniref:Uncharacterized protein n=1 Tax=Daphnia magna TaxID=35525 RepID=A0ABR0AQB0_9CRUS|nr:hypothetical protein OUZ56_016316 [Daphnia magna]